MNNDRSNNITNINEYRENIMPDTSAFNIDNQATENMEEFVSEEFVNAYLQATGQNTPDLWSRIEAGFEIEAGDIRREQRARATRTKKVLGFVAAVALITIIAIPVMMMGIGGEKSEEMMYTESTTIAEQEAYYDSAEDSVAMEAPADSAMDSAQEEGAVEQVGEPAAETGSENTVTNANTTIDSEINSESGVQLKDIQGVQTDERQIVIAGKFLFDSNSNQVSFEIKDISTNQYTDIVIDIGDKITLSNSMYILSMDVMLVEGRITLDSVQIDNLGNISGRIINLEHQGISIEKEYIEN